MPANMRPIEPVEPQTHRWIIPNLLPVRELVFVDGVPGVGKSIFCASTAASMSGVPGRDSPMRILYITSNRQAAERDDHLRTQDANLGLMVEAPFVQENADWDTQNPMVVFHFIEHVREQLKVQPTLFVIIDDLEELLENAGIIEERMYRRLWSELQAMAQEYCTTFIIPRRHGLHENRNYGLYTKTGNDMSRFILTMQYHPCDPRQRVITVARHLRGPAGIQWLFHFEPSGMMRAIRAESHQEVQPGNKLRTWTPDTRETHDDASFMEMLNDKMQGKPMTRAELLEHALSQGYSATRFRAHMSRLKLNQVRDGNTRRYQPNYEMLNALDAQRREAETRRAPTPPHDVSKISVAPTAASAAA